MLEAMILLFLSLLLFLFLPASILAAAGDPATIANLGTVVYKSVLISVLTLAGAASMLMFLFGGFQYFSAGGDKEATARASRTLTYAIIGLVISLSSWIILNLLGSFLGYNFRLFNICITPC